MLKKSNDQTLNNLKNLEKYISTLLPEQKSIIVAEFNEKYANLLANKVNQEKVGLANKSVDCGFAALDLILPTIWFLFVTLILTECRNLDTFGRCRRTLEHKKCVFVHKKESILKGIKLTFVPTGLIDCGISPIVLAMAAYPVLLNVIQNLAKNGWKLYKTSPDQEKQATLTRIKQALSI